ncbi:hypothetical protein BDW75DRAFT_246411 [Aspergillus navahoensis]
MENPIPLAIRPWNCAWQSHTEANSPLNKLLVTACIHKQQPSLDIHHRLPELTPFETRVLNSGGMILDPRRKQLPLPVTNFVLSGDRGKNISHPPRNGNSIPDVKQHPLAGNCRVDIPIPKLAIAAITYPNPAEPIQMPIQSGCSHREEYNEKSNMVPGFTDSSNVPRNILAAAWPETFVEPAPWHMRVPPQVITYAPYHRPSSVFCVLVGT